MVGDEPCVQSPFTPGRAVGGTAGPLVADGAASPRTADVGEESGLRSP